MGRLHALRVNLFRRGPVQATGPTPPERRVPGRSLRVEEVHEAVARSPPPLRRRLSFVRRVVRAGVRDDGRGPGAERSRAGHDAAPRPAARLQGRPPRRSRSRSTACSTSTSGRTATRSPNFKQRDPDEGATPSQRTEVRLAYDDDALYVGARLHDDRPGLDPRAPVAARRVDPGRSLLGLPRSAARPAQRLLLPGQRGRHAVRRHAVERRLGGRLVGRRLGGQGPGRRPGLDRRDAHPLLAAALRLAAGRHDLGRELPPRHPAQQRGGVPRLPAQEGERVRLALPRTDGLRGGQGRLGHRVPALRHRQGRVAGRGHEGEGSRTPASTCACRWAAA